MESMRELITKIRRQGLEFTGRYYGTYMAIVIENKDFADRGKLVVRPSDISGVVNFGLECYYKGIVGKGMGVHWVPSKGDVVFIEFRRGNKAMAYWSHSFYARKEKPEGLGLNDIGFTFPDGTFVSNNHEENTLTIKHMDGSEVVVSTDGVSIGKSKPITIGDKGLKYNGEYLLKGPATVSELSSLADMIQLISDGLSATAGYTVVPAIKALLIPYKVDIKNLDTT